MAQKPVIDTGVFDNWPIVSRDARISNDGKYTSYSLTNQTYSSHVLIIQSVDAKWKLKVQQGTSPAFTEDSKYVLFLCSGDSLCLFNLSIKKADYISDVVNFQLFMNGGRQWLLYQLKDHTKSLVLQNLKDKRTLIYPDVMDYKLSDNGAVLAFRTKKATGQTVVEELSMVSFAAKNVAHPEIIKAEGAVLEYCLDKSGAQLAFIVKDTQYNRENKSIWYYKMNMERPVKLVDGSAVPIGGSLRLNDLTAFSRGADKLFFTLTEEEYQNEYPDMVNVDVWSYTDAKLQSQQLQEDVQGRSNFYIGPRSYTAMADIKTGKIIRLQEQDEELCILDDPRNEGWAVVTKRKGNKSEESWNEMAKPSYYLVSLKNGGRKKMEIPFLGISPSGRYLVGDDDRGNIFTYELSSGIVHDVTRNIPVAPGDEGSDMPGQINNRGISFWGHWLADDSAMFVYDKYDIWEVDPQGKRMPLNLTSGYGRRNHVTFRFISDDVVFKKNQQVVLDAFGNDNKENGFYSVEIGEKKDPVALTMGPYVFYARSKTFVLDGEAPTRARDAESYVVRRCSATESPNYFWTRDFKKFTALSNVYPERNYNWLKSELVQFATLDGRNEKGILYKPENFNSNKKYPVIIHYYEKKSDLLNQYLQPRFSDGNINIPYFVSRGYLVFTPDIHFITGEIGQCAYNTIVAAGKFLQQKPWVDSQRIGISGHSFGGFETNYVIAHSDMFAAACADAGAVDLIDAYGTYELSTGAPLHELYEQTSYRMGAPLWERPDLYIKNSSIFQVEKVNTPVLIINNKKDAIVHFNQGVQLFTALRRLGKPSWMLQYDDEEHSLLQRRNQADLNTRIIQFFDYYLKAKLPPKWMTQGVPARKRGSRQALEYDSSYNISTQVEKLDSTR